MAVFAFGAVWYGEFIVPDVAAPRGISADRLATRRKHGEATVWIRSEIDMIIGRPSRAAGHWWHDRQRHWGAPCQRSLLHHPTHQRNRSSDRQERRRDCMLLRSPEQLWPRSGQSLAHKAAVCLRYRRHKRCACRRVKSPGLGAVYRAPLAPPVKAELPAVRLAAERSLKDLATTSQPAVLLRSGPLQLPMGANAGAQVLRA